MVAIMLNPMSKDQLGWRSIQSSCVGCISHLLLGRAYDAHAVMFYGKVTGQRRGGVPAVYVRSPEVLPCLLSLLRQIEFSASFTS